MDTAIYYRGGDDVMREPDEGTETTRTFNPLQQFIESARSAIQIAKGFENDRQKRDYHLNKAEIYLKGAERLLKIDENENEKI